MQIEEVNGRAEPVTGFHWLCPFQLLFYFSDGSAQDKNNYRPLTLVMHVAKVLERIIQIQLLTYMDDHEFITIDQSAYLMKHSTQTSLHRLIADILENRNNNAITGLCLYINVLIRLVIPYY